MSLPQRKLPRLQDFDYSQDGVYFITICTYQRKNTLSKINPSQDLETATTELTPIGMITEKYLMEIPRQFPFANVELFSIMPNHVHILLSLLDNANTKNDISKIIGQTKSLISKECREKFGINKVFQTSFYDHVIRNEKDYSETFNYILHNPGKWIYDKYYSDGTIAT